MISVWVTIEDENAEVTVEVDESSIDAAGIGSALRRAIAAATAEYDAAVRT